MIEIRCTKEQFASLIRRCAYGESVEDCCGCLFLGLCNGVGEGIENAVKFTIIEGGDSDGEKR